VHRIGGGAYRLVGRSAHLSRRRDLPGAEVYGGGLAMLQTTVVGSYPQPIWLIDGEALRGRLPPRIRARELWRVPPELLETAQDDATALAVAAMERAGIEVVTDGEQRRESYSNHFATALEGVDLDRPGTAVGRNGAVIAVPRIVGPVRRARPVGVRDVEVLRRLTDRLIKATVPGPFTMTQQAQDDFYGDPRQLALALAEAVNAELRDLADAGADIVQLDEPWLQARADAARDYALEAIDRALAGVQAVTALHTCHGYAAVVSGKPAAYPFLDELNECSVRQISIEAAQPRLDPACLRALPDKEIILGVLDLAEPAVETPEAVAGRIRSALDYVEAGRLLVAPDCGMKYLDRDLADAKLRALVAGAALVRRELLPTAG
jgi:5-methyltetrahydropteroyltriglutamate--homocysteine methyltransferase